MRSTQWDAFIASASYPTAITVSQQRAIGRVDALGLRATLFLFL